MPEALAPAKINLFLHAGPVRPDGFHPVCSLMEKVSLYDRLSVESSTRPGVRLSGSMLAGENTVEKAARLLGEAMSMKIGADITLEKQIPVAAGLAGGSSDAAAALKLFISTFGLEVSDARLMEVALAVGADVPFFLKIGAQLAEGAGEFLSPAPGIDYAAVIVSPAMEISTARIYHLYDEMFQPQSGPFQARCRRAKSALPLVGDLDSLAGLLHNDLEPAAVSLCPQISGLKEDLLALGAAGALMSGSGPSVFGLFAGKTEAENAALELAKNHSRVWAVTPVRSS